MELLDEGVVSGDVGESSPLRAWKLDVVQEKPSLTIQSCTIHILLCLDENREC